MFIIDNYLCHFLLFSENIWNKNFINNFRRIHCASSLKGMRGIPRKSGMGSKFLKDFTSEMIIIIRN